MGETDVTFRRLLRGLPRPILRLAFPRQRLSPLGPLDPSVDRPRQRTADSLFRVRRGAQEAAVHVEIERDWRPEIAFRLFEYASNAHAATRLPIWSVVVLLRPGGRLPSPHGLYRVAGIGGDSFRFQYHLVPLWRLDARRMRGVLGAEGAPFCAAMRGADEAFVRTLADDIRSARRLPRPTRETTTQLLYVVSAAILGSEAADRIFSVDSLIQDPNVQRLIRKWEDKGRAEGRAEEARAILMRILATRGLTLTSELRARVECEQDLTQLEAWLDAAISASAIEAVFGVPAT